MEFCHGHCKLHQLLNFLFQAQRVCTLSCGVSKDYNCGLQFSFCCDTMKYFKEHVWNFIYLAKRSVCCFCLWNQVFIRLLYDLCSALGNILHQCFILGVFIIKFGCAKFSKGSLSLGNFFHHKIFRLALHIFVHLALFIVSMYLPTYKTLILMF